MKNSKLVFALSLLFMFSFNGIQAQTKSKLSEEQKEVVVSQLKADKERLALTFPGFMSVAVFVTDQNKYTENF